MTVVKLCVLVLLVAEVTGQQNPELKELQTLPPVIEESHDAVPLPKISRTFETSHITEPPIDSMIEPQSEAPTFHHEGVPIPEIDVTVEPGNEPTIGDHGILSPNAQLTAAPKPIKPINPIKPIKPIQYIVLVPVVNKTEPPLRKAIPVKDRPGFADTFRARPSKPKKPWLLRLKPAAIPVVTKPTIPKLKPNPVVLQPVTASTPQLAQEEEEKEEEDEEEEQATPSLGPDNFIVQPGIRMTLPLPLPVTKPHSYDLIPLPKILKTAVLQLVTAEQLDKIVQPEIKPTSRPKLQKSNTNISDSENGGVQSGVKDKEKERETVKLYVTSVMYYICPVLLVCGATLQIFLILRFHRDHLGSYITMLYDSVMKLIFIMMVLFVIYYKKRDRTICGIMLCAEMTCIGCVCLSTCLATLYKLIMIKFPLTSYRWTSTRTQVKVCLVGTLIVFICSTWLGWDTFKLGTKMGFCNYKSANYKRMMLGWIILIIGSTTVASVAMLIYIAFIVLKFRIEKVKRDGHQKSASTVKTETSFVVDTTVDTNGPIPVKPQPMLKIPEKSPPPEKAKFPTQIIVLILLTMGMALPWIPGFINPMWYYKRDRIVLDIVYSTMLLLIALSPFLTTLLRLSLRNDLIGLFKTKRGKK